MKPKVRLLIICSQALVRAPLELSGAGWAWAGRALGARSPFRRLCHLLLFARCLALSLGPWGL